MTIVAMMTPGSNYLTLTIYGIKESAVSFGRGQFTASSRAGAQYLIPKITEIEHYPNRPQDIRTVQPEGNWNMLSDKTYFLTFAGLPTGGEQFTLSMPPLVTKDGETAVPIITFSKITEWRMEMVVLNC